MSWGFFLRHLGADFFHGGIRLWRREGTIGALNKGLRHLRWRFADELKVREVRRAATTEEAFTRIFHTRLWPGQESVSGPGSSLESTANIRRHLPILFEELSIRTVFDAPCGDCWWMKDVVARCDVSYVGADIVRPLIEDNRRRHTHPRMRFEHLDVTKDPFPKADLWLCRDCFCHLPLEMTFQALERFVESGIPYALLSTTKTTRVPRMNEDIRAGDFRDIDLFKPPYIFPPPLRQFDDQEAADALLALWSREQIKEALVRMERRPSPT